MGPNLAAIAFAIASIAGAIFILPRDMFFGMRYRVAAAWFLGMPLISFVGNPLLLCLILFAFLMAIAPFKPDRRLFLFMALIPVIPLYIQTELPFPGINYLLSVNYYKTAVIALLLPLFFIPLASDLPRQHWSILDLCVLTYILYSTIQIGAYIGLTGGLRFMLDQILVIGIPYFALTRFATRPAIVETCLKGVVVSAVILGAIALTVTAKQWDFYRIVHFDPIAAAVEVRGGFLRVQATLNTHSLGYLLAIAVVCLEYFKFRMRIGFLWLWAMRGVLIGGMYFTGSRGAMVGLVVALAIYVVLSIRNAALRWALIIGGVIFGSIAAYVLMFGNAAEYDSFGSFTYRQWLLDASLEYIAMYPLFGNVGYIDSGHFDHLVQGQGIIDITNMYLQIALNYGLVGLILFFLPFVITIVRLALLALKKRDEEGAGMYALICGALAGWLVLIATTSDVALTLHLGLAFLALGHAMAQRTAHAPLRHTAPAGAWTPDNQYRKAPIGR
jgi:hypothetical protein